MEIFPLSRCPQYFLILAHWAFFQWYYHKRIDFRAVTADYRRRADFSSLPVSWVAVDEGAPVGMISFKNRDLSSHSHLSPWLSALYVIPELRKKGLGGELIKTVQDYALGKGFSRIYLFTDHKDAAYLSGYYAERGWLFLEKAVDSDGMEIEILYYNLA
ncbi:MAG: GNAT family N-acetyltransferase [Spirochaetota bacterium]